MSSKSRFVLGGVVWAFAAMVASSAFGQAQDKDQQKCINAVNKDAGKVAATQGKANSGCVKTGTKGAVTASCPTDDPKGKLSKAEGKTGSDETKDCLAMDLPTFGYTSSGTANNAAVSNELDLLSDEFGSTDLSAKISTDKTIGKCQAAVAKDVEKVAANTQKDYIGCKKTALKGGAGNASVLQACVNSDGKGKIAAAVSKLQGDYGKDCGTPGVSSTVAFGPTCSGAADVGLCLGHKAICEMCQAINGEDGLSTNCDLADDGNANGSCSGGGPVCGITGSGRYTQTTTGGVLKVSTFQPFQFPSGGMTIQDVGAPNAQCVSDTVIPYPGGLTVPLFCVPALGYTVQVSQTGCGIGIIDSDGGSDLTTTEVGDTSYNLNGCAASQSCASFVDSSGNIDVTVGDGTADTCSTGGTGNAMVSIPVNTVTWLAEDSSCPDADGAPPEGGDTIITQFPQTLDLTSDRATASYGDLNADGCSLKGAGPAGPYTMNQICFGAGNPYACCTGAGTGTCVGNGAVGQCIDFGAQTVSVAGGGTVFSSAAPLHDLLFTTVQPANISGPTAFLGATCGSPPVINFAGLAHRCIIAP